MPGFDKTGPRGLGPRTGRGLGICGGCCGRCPFCGKPSLEEYKKSLEEELEMVNEEMQNQK